MREPNPPKPQICGKLGCPICERRGSGGDIDRLNLKRVKVVEPEPPSYHFAPDEDAPENFL